MGVLRKYWHANVNITGTFAKCPPVVCADGFTMSVQASEGHYCAPRETLSSGAYGAWEVGYPSVVEDALLPYAEDKERPTDTVYGWVPTEVIEQIIERHGGLRAEAV